ncbi:amidohydrolase [bacterium]|nr:amidohydrolase [bacterium]
MRRAARLFALVLAALAAAPGALAAPDLAAAAARLAEKMRADRRWLHANAELSLREFAGQGYLREQLAALPGVELVPGDWGTGLVALIRGGRPGPLVAWRADMDALPITEATGLAFACARRDTVSGGRETGVMHACGHDLHMAIGLGLARLASGLRAELPGTLMLVFQPAEEIGAGAMQLLAAGLFAEGRKPKSILALHVHPTLAVGQIGYCPGWATANVDGFLLTVKGDGGHGAYPHRGVDPVTLAAEIVIALQTLVAREIDVNHNAVISVGRIEGGAKSNVIPGEVLIEATVRSQDDSTRQALADKVKRRVNGLAAAAAAPAPLLEYYFGTAAGYNDPALTRQVIGVIERVLGPEAAQQYEPGLGGEDFAYYGREVPGFQFRLGTAPPGAAGAAASLHTPDYDPDEAALLVGLRVAAAAIWDQLERRD